MGRCGEVRRRAAALTWRLKSNMAALVRVDSAISSTASSQAGQKSPVTAGMTVDSPLYVYGMSRVSWTSFALPQFGHFMLIAP